MYAFKLSKLACMVFSPFLGNLTYHRIAYNGLPTESVLSRLPSQTSDTRRGRAARQEFLDKGGVIKKLEPGESADFGIHDNDYKKVLRAKKII
jgi:hypothetical protein